MDIPEPGTLKPKAVASLSGLAPFSREPGKWKGKRFVSGGRKFLPDALYMPAMVAMRFNHDMKTIYQRLIKAGKPTLAAHAIMRKLIILANALIREDRLWTEKRTISKG